MRCALRLGCTRHTRTQPRRTHHTATHDTAQHSTRGKRRHTPHREGWWHTTHTRGRWIGVGERTANLRCRTVLRCGRVRTTWCRSSQRARRRPHAMMPCGCASMVRRPAPTTPPTHPHPRPWPPPPPTPPAHHHHPHTPEFADHLLRADPTLDLGHVAAAAEVEVIAPAPAARRHENPRRVRLMRRGSRGRSGALVWGCDDWQAAPARGGHTLEPVLRRAARTCQQHRHEHGSGGGGERARGRGEARAGHGRDRA